MDTQTGSMSLLYLLSNPLIFNNIIPHIDVQSLCSFGVTNKLIRSLITQSQDIRYINLSHMKKRLALPTTFDSGGNRWSLGQVDETFTEDEFYGAPIRNIFSSLENKSWLFPISTMVLDGLTITVEVVQQIISEDRFNVRLLSLRDCKQLNEGKLCGLLKYVTRSTRPVGTPKLKGLYVFGPKDEVKSKEMPQNRRHSPTRFPDSRPSEAVNQVAIHLGEDWANRTKAALKAEHHEDDDDKWYHPAGRLITKSLIPEWVETLQACEGIIHFDAVLCRGPRHQYTGDRSLYLPPSIATVALGPDGCETCKSCPEGPGIFGQTCSSQLPLLAPPPMTSCSIRSAQKPSSSVRYEIPKMIARCRDCLKSRWCERCHKWWCEDCLGPKSSSNPSNQQNNDNISNHSGHNNPDVEDSKMGAERQCFGCGQTCMSCNDLFMRKCGDCSNEYCVVDNDGSTTTHCDWCVYGRRTRHYH